MAIRNIACMRVAPSTSAASSSSRGMPLKKPISIHVQNGMRNVGYVRIRAHRLLKRWSSRMTKVSGRNSSVGGTR